MSKVGNNNAGYGWDSYGCNHIGDFDKGAGVLVNARAGRERGIIEKIDTRKLRVFYRKSDGQVRYAYLNSIIGQWSRDDLFRLFVGEGKKYETLDDWLGAE